MKMLQNWLKRPIIYCCFDNLSVNRFKLSTLSMKDNKLFAAFKTLTPKELGRFEKFIDSPFFNEHEGLKRLLVYLKHKCDEGLGYDNKEMFLFCFGKYEYDDLRLRHLMSDFLKLIEMFFAVNNFMNDDLKKDLATLKILREKGLEKHFKATRRRLDKEIISYSKIDNELMHDKHLYEMEINKHIGDKFERKGKNNIQKSAEYLDRYFIVKKIRYACTQINNKGIFDEDYKLFLLDEIVTHVEIEDYAHDVLIQSYYLVYMALNNLDENSHYDHLKAIVNREGNNFSGAIGRELYSLITNYCIKQVNRGKRIFYEELFYFYQLGTEYGYLMTHNGEISPFDFRNMVVVGCQLKEYDWVERFINSNHHRIPQINDQSSLSFNLALLFWFKKDYKNVLRLISRIEFDDPFYALDAKTILLKIYFELGEFDSLNSISESFRIYLRRNKLISKTHLTNYLNLIKFAARLAKIRENQFERLQKIKAEINDLRNVSNKKWLLDQIKLMEEKMED